MSPYRYAWTVGRPRAAAADLSMRKAGTNREPATSNYAAPRRGEPRSTRGGGYPLPAEQAHERRHRQLMSKPSLSRYDTFAPRKGPMPVHAAEFASLHKQTGWTCKPPRDPAAPTCRAGPLKPESTVRTGSTGRTKTPASYPARIARHA